MIGGDEVKGSVNPLCVIEWQTRQLYEHTRQRVWVTSQHNFFHLMFPFVSAILTLYTNNNLVYTWL